MVKSLSVAKANTNFDSSEIINYAFNSNNYAQAELIDTVKVLNDFMTGNPVPPLDDEYHQQFSQVLTAVSHNGQRLTAPLLAKILDGLDDVDCYLMSLDVDLRLDEVNPPYNAIENAQLLAVALLSKIKLDELKKQFSLYSPSL